MKSLHSASKTWNTSISKDSVLISMPGTNKRFKRKSREPKRLFSSPEPESTVVFPADMSDLDHTDDIQVQTCNLSGSTPLQRHLMIQEAKSDLTAGYQALVRPEGGMALTQSGAIDMRISTHVPAIMSKLSQVPASQFSHSEVSHWPSAISQPLSNRLKLGFHPTFPLTTSSSSSSHSLSPSHQAISLDPSLLGQADPRSSHCHEHVEAEGQSPKESPKKQVGLSTERPGRLPEVKAIQQTRRLLANARERTRVHTISAAFEALRKQVPCYSYGQKLSKLAILRIACNYILSLAQLAELDYSPDHSSLSFSQCVEQCTRTLQAEGRSKKRKVGRMEDV
ncbi:transcription factor atoh8 [Betta splendens]|uniref:Protein atonal homolog 8 n=1 Tax=Betta splendens TaxID=158456 RepID=A0A6P7NV29_BETSP|nr:transcription factor atoh8 [Betta splendens]